ncbi:PAS domain-containing protein [Parathalassolituus penaei]|uniref:PAS domain-containing protein n=1 Tax=Parathalassolituus penaei TaxID=2997323 RepID=A0A9X3IR94_9GAMM|nr:PAS domain-containing protein [Parathalassolituus penaei]MCY0964641.1 PAS domain-containing protein [Parathalassolituus penaei]
MSNQGNIELGDIHWLMDILQNIDVGLVVMDSEYRIQLWNGFMESHSGLSPQVAKGENLFKLFPDIPETWFREKCQPVFQLKTRTFTIWEQRPYLFHFKNYRPITGRATFMYQNTAIIPLESISRSIDHICVIIYDVTDIAINRRDHELQLAAIQPGRDTPSCSASIIAPAIPAASALEVTNKPEPAAPDITAHQIKPQATETIESAVIVRDRHSWDDTLNRQLARCARSEQPGCLVCLQIDNNSSHYDESLLALFNRSLRQSDTAYHCDDLLFALLDNSDAGDARFFAERVRKAIKRLGDHYSVSIGIAPYIDEFESGEDWQLAAEEALLQARHQGLDCNQVFEP